VIAALLLGRYIEDMRNAIREVGRVLTDRGKATYVVGENTVGGTTYETPRLFVMAEMAEMTLDSRGT